jgi:hypothetical protein
MSDIAIDVVFHDSGKLAFIIKQGILEMNFIIACPKKYGIEKWKDLRDSKTGGIRYDGCKMNNRKGYNITVLYSEDNGNYQYIRCNEGIIEFAIEQNRDNREKSCLMFVKIPMEICYEAFDKIIEKYSDL